MGFDNISKEDHHRLALSARLRCLLTLRHLSRVKDIAYKFARNIQVMKRLLSVSGKMDSSANAVCIAIFADLTRHPQNSLQLVYHVSGFLKALVDAAKLLTDKNNNNDDHSKCRQYACYAMQNLSCNMGCRQELAITQDLLYTLSKCGLHFNYPEEQIAAIGTLKNISNDPSNFIHLSNTTTCFNALIYLAGGAIHNNHLSPTTKSNNDDEKKEEQRHKEMLQYLACDALATLSNWIAASALAGMNVVSNNNNKNASNNNNNDDDDDSEDSDGNNSDDGNNAIVFTKEMMKPKLVVQPWNQWE